MSRNKKALIFALLTLFVTLFIFGNSLRSGEESAEQSGFFVDILNNVLETVNIHPNYDSISFFIRKAAHFSEYFLLSALAAMGIFLATTKKQFIFISPLYSFIIAVCDEFICQAMTEGRGPQWTDVMIDTSGALIAALILFLIIHFKKITPKE